MAVENKWAVDEQETLYPQTTSKKEGQVLRSAIGKVAIAAADDDGSKYGLAKVPGQATIKDIKLALDDITGGTDYDIGLYRIKADETIGDVIDKDMFLDGQSMAVEKLRGSEITGISALAIADSDKTIAELAAAVSGLTEKDPVYALVLTANTVGTGAGNIVVFTDFVSNI